MARPKKNIGTDTKPVEVESESEIRERVESEAKAREEAYMAEVEAERKRMEEYAKLPIAERLWRDAHAYAGGDVEKARHKYTYDFYYNLLALVEGALDFKNKRLTLTTSMTRYSVEHDFEEVRDYLNLKLNGLKANIGRAA